MIYFLSDLHGSLEFEALDDYIKNSKSDDLLIILGDIGLAFEETSENKRFTEDFLNINKNIAILDGNHENFEYINSFPEEEWNGGYVHRLSEHIVHLKRGNVYCIDNKTFFVFGGCKSSPKWKEMGLWHFGEEPTEEELRYAYTNLKKHNYRFDYILTHKYEETPGLGTVCADLQKLNKFIDTEVQFEKWYAGHWHENTLIDEKHIIVYDKLTPVER